MLIKQSVSHTHIHTHIYIHIYMYVYICIIIPWFDSTPPWFSFLP
jgi:hypothetical protein